MLSLCTVVFATAAGVTILRGDFNPMAESAYALLSKQFEFEFLTVRLSYLSSLLSFAIGIAGRILLEYKRLHKERREEAIDCGLLWFGCCGDTHVVIHKLNSIFVPELGWNGHETWGHHRTEGRESAPSPADCVARLLCHRYILLHPCLVLHEKGKSR